MRNGTTTTYTYDNNNRLISEVSSSQVKSYTYDANGNQLTAISNGNYAGAYTYDLWNMQATYTVDGTGITSYTYRPDGLRHSVQGKVHIWDNGNIIADIGSDTVYYIRALTLIYSQSGDTKTYYRFNGHGDVIALANANGAITKQYIYDAFGVEENPSVFDTNVFRYCAEYFDVETNTIYLRARYYDAKTGRFTQQDGWNYAVPGFLLSLNLYTYCWNNPIKYSDPSGRVPRNPMNNKRNVVCVDEYIASGEEPVTCINGQEVDERVKDRPLGKRNMSYNGCEAIAIYNACVLAGEPVPLDNVIEWCEENALWLDGKWGCKYWELGHFWDDNKDYDVSWFKIQYWGSKNRRKHDLERANNELETCDVIIVSYFNSFNVLSGIHTVAIQKSEDGILVYNYYSNRLEPTPFESLYDCLCQHGWSLFCIGINRR